MKKWNRMKVRAHFLLLAPLWLAGVNRAAAQPPVVEPFSQNGALILHL
jgi:hypothetical protein